MAIETAADVLGMFDTADFAVSVTLTRAGASWSPATVPAILSEPIEPFGLADAAGIVAAHVELLVPVAALPADPAEDDGITLPDGSAYAVTVAVRDLGAVMWTLRLKSTPAALTDGSGSGITIGGASIFP